MSSLCNDVFALVRSSLFKCQRFYCWKCDKSIYLISWFLTVIDNYDGVQWDIGFLTKKICKLCQYNERLMLLLIMMTGHTILTSTQHTRLCCYLSVRPMKMPNGAISPKQFKKNSLYSCFGDQAAERNREDKIHVWIIKKTALAW